MGILAAVHAVKIACKIYVACAFVLEYSLRFVVTCGHHDLGKTQLLLSLAAMASVGNGTSFSGVVFFGTK